MWKKLTQTYIVDRVEPCIAFWTEHFGFRTTIAVPEGEGLGFVTLRRDSVEISYRSRASLVADIGALADLPEQEASVMTIELDSVDEIVAKLESLDVIVPRRRTFYGNNEVIIRGPAGQVVIFTAPGEEPTMMLKIPKQV
jgi:hypothetical protein